MADAMHAGDRRELRRGRYAGRGHHADRRPRRRRGGRARAAGEPEPGRATSSPPRPRPPARRSPARPSSCRSLRDAGVVDAGGRGVCVILDAAETVLTGRRPTPVDAPIGPAPIPSPTAGRRPGRGRAGVRGDVPPRRPRRPDPGAASGTLAGLGDSLVVVGGEGLWNVHVHVDDVGAAIEAGIEAGRPHRVAGHPLRRAGAPRPRAGRGRRGAGAGSSRSPPGRAWPRCSRRPAPSSCTAAPAAGPRPGSCSRRSPRSGAAEVVVLPNDPDSVRGRRRSRPAPPRRTTACGSR